jgi:hypothetical protein
VRHICFPLPRRLIPLLFQVLLRIRKNWVDLHPRLLVSPSLKTCDSSFDRRFRIYDISGYGETISTYKVTEHDDILDEMILAGSGAPPL